MPCGESSIPFLIAGVLWRASSMGAPPSLPFPAGVTLASGHAWSPFLFRNIWGGMELPSTCAQRPPQGFGSRGGFCALTVLAGAEDPYVSTSSDCSKFNAEPGPFLQPLVQLVPAIVVRGRKQRGVPQGAGKPGAPQAQQEACRQGRPSWASTRVPRSMCVIP